MLPDDAPEPGPWRTDRVPFWKAIYQAFEDPQYDTVAVCCGSQMSKTEGMLNLAGKVADVGPYVPVLIVEPTEKLAKKIATDRFDKMLEAVPRLKRRKATGHKDKTYEKQVGGVRVTFLWAGSPTELASNPAGLALIDERDRMSDDVGGEGDPVTLVQARTENYLGAKVGVFGTPLIEGASPTWALYLSGTRFKWAWTCLHCDGWFIPRLELLKWPQGATPEQARAEAVVVCDKCGCEHTNQDKAAMNAGGFYVAHAMNENGDEYPVSEPVKTSVASFWISGLASPWRSFGKVAEKLVRAYQNGAPAVIQAVVNTQGGEVFRVKGEAPEWEEVGANRIELPPLTIIHGMQRITLGADVQKYGIFYTLRAWGFNSESWLLEHGFIAGETEYDGPWITLGNLLQRPIGDRKIDRAFIDSGYRPGEKYRRPDHAVYTFTRRFPGLAFPTKGHDMQETPVRFKFVDYTHGGQVIRNGIRLYHIDTDYWKRWLHSRVRWPDDQPGGWHLHRETSEDYCRQIVAEEMITKASGRHAWIMRKGCTDNHYLDCEVNAAAAAYDLGVHKLLPTPDETPPKPDPKGKQEVARSGYERRGLLG